VPDSSLLKYNVKLKFTVDGVVEKADVIGAIFGQTEGLFGPEMNLNELQKTWKVGRIEINLSSASDSTTGEVLIPMSTDINTAALIAAAVESVDKVGPCTARFHLSAIDDARASKRRVITERAKLIVRDWTTKTSSVGEEVLKDVVESSRRAKLVSYGREELPAGPGVYTSDNVILVEGRADVINLLRAGLENVVALDGTKVPESVIRLSKEKRMIALLDGDRAGDLIAKELDQVARVEKVFRAPENMEVEDLTPVEVLNILKSEPPTGAAPPPRVERSRITGAVSEPVTEKAKLLYPQINGTLEAIILDEKLEELRKVPVSELVKTLENTDGALYVIFDGIITQRLIDQGVKAGVKAFIGNRSGDISRVPGDLAVATFRDVGIA
jgi:DNA primase